MRINNNIKCGKVLLIDQNGTSLGKLNLPDAMEKARMENLDLVEVSKGVCRLMDYGKFKYDKSKKEKKNKKGKKMIKEIQLSPNTGHNDLVYRAKRVGEFLNSGHKVKIVVKFKGRELNHMTETGEAILAQFIKLLENVEYNTDGQIYTEGKSIIFSISPVN